MRRGRDRWATPGSALLAGRKERGTSRADGIQDILAGGSRWCWGYPWIWAHRQPGREVAWILSGSEGCPGGGEGGRGQAAHRERRRRWAHSPSRVMQRWERRRHGLKAGLESGRWRAPRAVLARAVEREGRLKEGASRSAEAKALQRSWPRDGGHPAAAGRQRRRWRARSSIHVSRWRVGSWWRAAGGGGMRSCSSDPAGEEELATWSGSSRG